MAVTSASAPIEATASDVKLPDATAPDVTALNSKLPAVPAALLSVCRDLAALYTGVFSPETVVRTLYESYQLMIATSGQGTDAVHHAARFASDWLADAARGWPAHGGAARWNGPPHVLFICLLDSDRAQMAETLLRSRSAGRVLASSAGPVAARATPPPVSAAMAELGFVVSAQPPLLLLDEVVRAADVVVTMGRGDICPVYVGKRYYDWQLPEPVGRSLAAIRSVRDRIDEHVVDLLGELTATAPPRGASLVTR